MDQINWLSAFSSPTSDRLPGTQQAFNNGQGRKRGRREKVRMLVKEKRNGKFQNVGKNFVNEEHFLFINMSII